MSFPFFRALIVALLCALHLPTFAQTADAPKVMFVGAHPDDDSMATATLSRFAPNVTVVCATRGEGGGNATGHEGGKALGVVREGEQRRALRALGIEELYYLDKLDFGFTLSAEATELAWGSEEPLENLVRYIRLAQPDIIFTLHPGSGHGHHQFAARLATQAFHDAADPTRFPEQIEEEGLKPWQARQLFYAAEGCAGEFEVRADSATLVKEKQALRQYQSQGWHLNSVMPTQGDSEAFLTAFDLVGGGLQSLAPFPLAIQKLPLAAQPAKPETAIQLVLPSGSAGFVNWAKSYGLERLLETTSPLYPVALGDTASIEVQEGSRTHRFRYRGEKLGRSEVRPMGLPAFLAVVPKASLPFQAEISPEQIWEGEASGPEDLSAVFSVAIVEDRFQVRVEVIDDVVVGNLSKRDNRGHWRTDSVEIAIDPAGPGRSPHTLETVKVGVVPFTLEGPPMAARDADAKPGPVERTLPGTVIASRRTAAGYQVDIDIPLKSLDLSAKRPFGFNLMVYDADNPQAKAGENSNQGRLAWSAWPAVQGSTQLWGHIIPSP